MKRIINKIKKSTMFGFILGSVLFGSISFVLADLLFRATDFSYSNELTEKTDVSGALDELISKVKVSCPEGYVCKRMLYNTVASKSQGKLAYNEDSANNPFSKVAGCTTEGCTVDDQSQTSGVWEYDETTMDKNSDGGTQPIYYYRGAVSDNNVYFAGKCWLVIRTTSTGGVKLIYNGTKSGTEDDPVCNGTTPVLNANSQKFNTSYQQYYYSFYTYSTSSLLGTEESSLIKTYVEDTAYSTIGLDSTIEGTTKKWEDMLEDHPYCMDRRYNTSSSATTYDQYESNESTMYYGGYIRKNNTKKPALDCESEDQLTVANERIAKKVGLITVDELMLAGGQNFANYGYYLNAGTFYWSMSPSHFTGEARVIDVPTTGYLYEENSATIAVGVRPVISLASSAEIKKGDGTSSSPYIIKPIS